MVGDGLAAALGGAEDAGDGDWAPAREGVGEWLATGAGPPPQATAKRPAATTSAVIGRPVLICKTNATLRTWLRFRYHPRSEAGATLTRRAGSNGFVRRTALAVRFVLSGWRNRATLNLTEEVSHTV